MYNHVSPFGTLPHHFSSFLCFRDFCANYRHALVKPILFEHQATCIYILYLCISHPVLYFFTTSLFLHSIFSTTLETTLSTGGALLLTKTIKHISHFTLFTAFGNTPKLTFLQKPCMHALHCCFPLFPHIRTSFTANIMTRNLPHRRTNASMHLCKINQPRVA